MPGAPIEVWHCATELDARTIERCTTRLPAAEIERAARFRFEANRAEYVVGHAMLRTELGRRLGREPSSIGFVTGSHGKPLPAPDWADRGISFNLTHTNGLAAIALGDGMRIGIDAEPSQRPIEWVPLARRYFSPAEHAAILALPEARRARAFIACWCRKEALVKAHGHGIAVGLDTFDVNVDPDESPRALDCRGESWGARTWSLGDAPASPRHVVVVAAECERMEIVSRPWTPPGDAASARTGFAEPGTP